jgi:hypothetical protein
LRQTQKLQATVHQQGSLEWINKSLNLPWDAPSTLRRAGRRPSEIAVVNRRPGLCAIMTAKLFAKS